MKQLSNNNIMKMILCGTILLGSIFISCNKPDHFPIRPKNDASNYTSDVIDKWMTMQIRLERDATGIPNASFCRYYAYSGIAALEAIAPSRHLSFITRENVGCFKRTSY